MCKIGIDKYKGEEIVDITTQLVVAGNVGQFMGWCNEFGFDSGYFHYIWDAKSIYGFGDCYIHLVGTYWENPNYHKIMEYCCSHNIDLV